MGRDAFGDRESVLACLDALEATFAELERCSWDGFGSEELVGVLGRRERLAWRAPVIEHRILARLVAAGNPGELGAASLTKVLAGRLQISESDARRRLAEAADLGPRTALGGEPLEPVMPALAAAVAAGRVGPEHVEIARKAYARIPAAVSVENRARAEADLAALASQFGPASFRKLAEHLVAVLDPDGDFSDRQRSARRGVRIGRQGADGLSKLTATMTPELLATLEPVLAKLSAPGMCNPADEQPCVQGSPTEAQILADDRSYEQRQHDGLLAALRIVLCTGDLGQLNGLPVSVIVTTTLAELHAAAGLPEPDPEPEPEPAPGPVCGNALTAGGSRLPMSDLLRMAGHARHYLTIFDGAGRPLWLGRTKRIASADQRIVLHARDRGCTRPGCTVSGYHSQAHHLTDWALGGPTDINNLALACPADNRLASDHDWTTRLNDHGRVEWIAPPHLQHGQPRTNPYHFIEDLIDYHRTPPRPEPPENTHPEYRTRTDEISLPDPGGGPWLDDPLPGEPGYNDALDDLERAYNAMDLDRFAEPDLVLH